MSYGTPAGLHMTKGIVGPWQCEKCGQLSQFCHITKTINRVFCKNESCNYERLIDKPKAYIIEDDGTHWRFDQLGNKVRVR